MNNAQLMDGAIKCLEMFASGDNLSDEHLPRLIPLLFPHLLRIFSSVSALSLSLLTVTAVLVRVRCKLIIAHPPEFRRTTPSASELVPVRSSTRVSNGSL
jgi:hypothetical protein